MRAYLLATAAAIGVVLGALCTAPARADVVYTIDATNDFGTSGAGPFAQVDIHFIDSTHATAEFTRLGTFVFGEMGLDINASTFGISGLSVRHEPGSTRKPRTILSAWGRKSGEWVTSRWITRLIRTASRTR